MIFRGDEGNEEVPMVSRAEQSDASVVFLAKSRYIMIDQDDFRGQITVSDTIRKLIPAGKSLDLFDSVKLPSAMRGEANLKKELFEMFESWHKELVGPIAKESLEVKGPALIITPVAVYEA